MLSQMISGHYRVFERAVRVRSTVTRSLNLRCLLSFKSRYDSRAISNSSKKDEGDSNAIPPAFDTTASASSPNDPALVPRSPNGKKDDALIRSQFNVPSSLVVIPLHQRPLFPGVAIELLLSPKLYNCVLTSCLQASPNHDFHVAMFMVVPQANCSPALAASWFLDVPHEDDLFHVGTMAKVMALNASRSMVVSGLQRIELTGLDDREMLTVRVEPLVLSDREHVKAHERIEKARPMIIRLIETELMSETCSYPQQLRILRDTHERRSVESLVDQFIGLSTFLSPQQEQQLLSELNPTERLEMLCSMKESISGR